jgi:hypothetical protein
MSLFIPPVVHATDANNLALSGAKWYFYVTGTTTPASVYTTSTLSVAHANPVVADSGGSFAPIYLDPAVTYRAILKTAAGVTVPNGDIDPYNDDDPTVREKLDSDRSYYVRSDGNDGNSGLGDSTAGDAFLTIQKAIDTVYSLVDLDGHKITINVGDGTYTGGLKLYGRPAGSHDTAGQPLRIIGNEASPASVIISPSSRELHAGNLGLRLSPSRGCHHPQCDWKRHPRILRGGAGASQLRPRRVPHGKDPLPPSTRLSGRLAQPQSPETRCRSSTPRSGRSWTSPPRL